MPASAGTSVTAVAPGDHVVLPDDAYGGSFRLIARSFGAAVAADPWRGAGTGTSARFAETPVAQGLPAETPALTVTEAGLPGQRSVGGTVADIAERGEEAGVRAPAVTVIGPVAGLSRQLPAPARRAPTPPDGSSSAG